MIGNVIVAICIVTVALYSSYALGTVQGYKRALKDADKAWRNALGWTDKD